MNSMNCMSFFCFKVVLMMVAECGALHSLFVDPTSRSAGAKGNQTGSKAKLDPVGYWC